MIDIYNVIKNHQERNGNMCGYSFVALLNDLKDQDQSQVRSELNKLYKEGKINIREGINTKLIFLK